MGGKPVAMKQTESAEKAPYRFLPIIRFDRRRVFWRRRRRFEAFANGRIMRLLNAADSTKAPTANRTSLAAIFVSFELSVAFSRIGGISGCPTIERKEPFRAGGAFRRNHGRTGFLTGKSPRYRRKRRRGSCQFFAL